MEEEVQCQFYHSLIPRFFLMEEDVQPQFYHASRVNKSQWGSLVGMCSC